MPNDQPQAEREARIAVARRARLLKRLGWGAGVVAVLAGGVYAAVRYSGEQARNRPGIVYGDQGRPHVALDTPFSYNSNPPTSGPHFASPAEWGVYTEETHDQILIHNLEHGGIWIAYRPGIRAEVIAKLAAIAKEFGRKVIMAPRQANDSDIALAAWNRLDKFSENEFAEERVRGFIKAHRNKGPEFVP